MSRRGPINFKFRVALWLDRLFPRACWADLASWGMGMKAWDEIEWDARRRLCGKDLANNGHCWCGKFWRDDSSEVQP